MKRRSFIKTAAAGSLLAGNSILPKAHAQNPAGGRQQILELRHYKIGTAQKKALVADYLEKAYIPGANRAGIKPIGVFYSMPEANDHSIYRLTAFDSFDQFSNLRTVLGEDERYRGAAAGFFSTEKKDPAYQRIDVTLMRSFAGYPKMIIPRKGDRYFELRTYQSHDELKAHLKVEMFNVAELEIFRKVHLDGVFYGEVIAGNDMPRLTYMLGYEDKAEREKTWKDFLAHPDWTELKGRERYKDTVSKIEATFLQPTPFSQI